MYFYKDIFANNLKKISDKIFSISNHFSIFFNEKDRKIILDKIELECKEKVLNEEKRIKNKKGIFNERVKNLHQVINIKSKINQIWSDLQKNPLIASDLQEFIDSIKTEFGVTCDDLNNMNIDEHIVYFSSLIQNTKKINNSEKSKRISTKNNFKKHDILPWDNRLKNSELPNFLATNDSLRILQDVLAKFKQFQEKTTKQENKRRLSEIFIKFIQNELKRDPNSILKRYQQKVSLELTFPILNALRLLQDKKVLKVTSGKTNKKRLIPKKLKSKRLDKDIFNIQFDPKQLTREINRSVLILLARQK